MPAHFPLLWIKQWSLWRGEIDRRLSWFHFCRKYPHEKLVESEPQRSTWKHSRSILFSCCQVCLCIITLPNGHLLDLDILWVKTAGYGKFTSGFKAAVLLLEPGRKLALKAETWMFPTHTVQLPEAGRTNCFSHSRLSYIAFGFTSVAQWIL